MTHQHQHQLHASAALHSLRAALAVLDHRADDEYRAIATERAAAADPLKSPTFGRRHALGGHGDPTGDAILTIGTTRTNRWAELEHTVHSQLAGVAQHLPAAAGSPLDRIAAGLPAMSGTAAAATRRLLDRIDSRIRRLLHEPDDRQLLSRVRCPACDTVALVLRTSAPPADRIIQCTACDSAWTTTELQAGATA